METTMHDRENKNLVRAVASGSSSEAISGGAAIVLTILGLANIAPSLMMTISGIVISVGLLFEGGMVASEYSRIISRSGNGGLSSFEFGGGLSAQVIAGGAAAVLSVLGLLGLATNVLMPIAAIVIGGGVVLGSGVMSRLNNVKIATSGDTEVTKRAAQEAVTASAGAQVLVGLAAMVLGILGLVGIAPVTLTLVAFLAVGTSILLSGAAVSGRMMALFGGP